jgi:hypothetical protein
MTPDEADKLMTSGDGCCMFCEVDLNLGRGHGDWCKWPVIRAAWEMDLLCHKSFVEHHKSVDEQCLDLIKRLEAAEKELAGIALVSKGPHHLMMFDWVGKLRFIHNKAKNAVAALAGRKP